MSHRSYSRIIVKAILACWWCIYDKQSNADIHDDLYNKLLFSRSTKTQMIFFHIPVKVLNAVRNTFFQCLFAKVLQLCHVCTVLCWNVSELKSLRRLQGERELESVTLVGLNCGSSSALLASKVQLRIHSPTLKTNFPITLKSFFLSPCSCSSSVLALDHVSLYTMYTFAT